MTLNNFYQIQILMSSQMICLNIFSVKQCRKLADGNGLWDPGSETVKHAVYDLCWCVLRGQLKQELAFGALADINVRFLLAFL